MSGETLEMRHMFSTRERHRIAVLRWLDEHGPEARRRRAHERDANRRNYVLYDDDPDYFLDGYEGDVGLSPYNRQRH